jgi:hypothetical protein
MFLFALSVNQIANAQSPTRAELQAQIEYLRSELNTKEAQFLEPTSTDRLAYAELLSLSDTGLVRLLPREAFDIPDKLTVRGGGAYYSFSHLTHEYGKGSDIELCNGEFSVGFAGADYGYLARVPAQPLIAITLDSPGVGALASRATATVESEARKEQVRSRNGFSTGGIRYADRVPAEVGATYLLRSVNYGFSDLLICFQVVREDEDGSLILAWRLLKRFPIPELTRTAQATSVVNSRSN